MTARDFVEHNRAVAAVPLAAAVLVLAAVAADVLAPALTLPWDVIRVATFFAGLALGCVALRDLTARVDTEED